MGRFSAKIRFAKRKIYFRFSKKAIFEEGRPGGFSLSASFVAAAVLARCTPWRTLRTREHAPTPKGKFSGSLSNGLPCAQKPTPMPNAKRKPFLSHQPNVEPLHKNIKTDTDTYTVQNSASYFFSSGSRGASRRRNGDLLLRKVKKNFLIYILSFLLKVFEEENTSCGILNCIRIRIRLLQGFETKRTSHIIIIQHFTCKVRHKRELSAR